MNNTVKLLFRALLVLMLISLLMAAWAGWTLYQWVTGPISTTQTQAQVVELPPGSSATQVARLLQQADMLAQPEAFVWYLRYQDQAHQLKPGEYIIQPEWTFSELAEALIKGQVIHYGFTIIPGETWAQVQAKLATAPNLAAAEAQEWQALKDKLASWGWPQNLEGVLLPETYFYHKGETDIMMVRRAKQAMQRHLNRAWDKRREGLPIKTPYEALILASIIEKETGVAHERAKIAGVFTRRLEKGMRLQTDPTVIYGMGDLYQGRIGRKGLDTPTPYNTYIIRGLPPTPIAMPSAAAVDAALNPKDGDALYFVSKGNGEHHFSKTLQEHNQAVRRYILNR